MKNFYKFYANRDLAWNGIALHIVDESRANDGLRAIATNIVFTKLDQDGQYTPPPMVLSDESAQRLIDALWDAGVRPSEGTGSAGSLAATERHLSDMRQIAYHCMKISDKSK